MADGFAVFMAANAQPFSFSINAQQAPSDLGPA
jgi:hypothetical protein